MRTVVVVLMLLAGCTTSDGPDSTPDLTSGPMATPTPGPTAMSTAAPTGTADDTWVEGDCPGTGQAAPASAWVLTEAGVEAWDLDAHGAVRTEVADLDASWISWSPQGLFVANDTHVMRLGEDLRVEEALALRNITTFTAHEDRVYVVTDWRLVVLDTDLEERHRVAIEPPEHGPTKLVDHIAVTDGHAFLVDDVVMPFYGFVVRLDPEPEVTATVEWHATSGPSYHAIVDGVWHIHSNFGGMGGGSSWLERYDVEGNDLGHLPLSSSREVTTEDPKRYGHAVHTMDPTGQAMVRHDGLFWITLGEAIKTRCHAPTPPRAELGVGTAAVAVWEEGLVALWPDGASVQGGAPLARPLGVAVASD